MSLVKTAWLDACGTPGTETDPEEVTGATRYGLQVAATGSPATFAVWLEGSIDGENWSPLVIANQSSAGLVGFGQAAAAPVVRFIRLRLDALTGGSSPTVTASVVAV